MLPAEAVTEGSVDSVINEILTDEKTMNKVSSIQELLDGPYSKNAGVSSDWFVYTIMRYKGNSYNYSSYLTALEKHVNGDNYDTSTSKEKFALIFGAANTNQTYISKVMNEEIGQLGIMSNVFGLHLLNNGFVSSNHKSDELIAELLSCQNDDGGWALSGANSDIDVTAMVIQSLAPNMSDNKVKPAVNKAVSFLSSKQLANGGYKSYGVENPESAAQVILALTSLKINPLTDERFIKNDKSAVDFMLTFKATDYGYSHKLGGEYNITATSQVLYSLVSIKLMSSGKAFYVYNQSASPAVTQAESTTAQAAANTTKKQTTTKKSTTKKTTTRRATTVYSTTTRRNNRATTTAQSAASREQTTVLKEETVKASAIASETTEEATTDVDSSAEPVTELSSESMSVTDKSEILSETKSEEQSDTEANQAESKKTASPKVYIISGIWALALIGFVILVAKKNKKAVNYIIIAAVGGVLTAVILLSNIQTPDDFYNVTDPVSDNTITVTISITCDTVAGRGDESVTPSDGVILSETEITLEEGATVYDCLIKAAKLNKIQLEDNTQTLSDHTHAYIAGINNLYEFDYGELSGWMYSVDGDFADVGCGEYTLSGGETIEWKYTCNLGDDIK